MILGRARLGLALLAGGRLGDVPLVGDDVGRDLLAGEVLRAHRGDLHADGAGGVLVALVGRPARRPGAGRSAERLCM